MGVLTSAGAIDAATGPLWRDDLRLPWLCPNLKGLNAITTQVGNSTGG